MREFRFRQRKSFARPTRRRRRLRSSRCPCAWSKRRSTPAGAARLGLQGYQAREIAYKLGFKDRLASEAAKLMMNLSRVFVKTDASLAEINPLVITKDGKLLAIDAKFNFDDNALFRHNDVVAMEDETQEKPLDLRAKKASLNYIALDGAIGCLVNGAGLAMATMDIIKLHGAEPANFLDVGGSVTPEGAVEAFSIILSDPKV